MRSLQLDIAGLALRIRTDRSDADVQAATELVNRRYRRVAEGARALPDANRLAVVALLIAEELLDAQRALAEANLSMDETIEKIESTLAALHHEL